MIMNSLSCEKCPAFKKSVVNSLSTSQLRTLKENSIQLSFKKGQRIMTRHEAAQGIHCIRSGVVKYHIETKSRKSVTISLQTVGDPFGHHELLTGRSVFSVSCLTDVETCFFPSRLIHTMFARVKSFSRRIVTDVNKDVEEIAEYLAAVCFKTIRQRVAYSIQYLNLKFGTSEDGFISLPLSRKDFSDIVCAPRESVYRELMFLQKKKYVKLRNQHIKIEDEAKLAEVVDG